MGDLKNSRTIHSLVKLLIHFKNIKFIYISHKGMEMPEELLNEITEIEQISNISLDEALKITDVLYVTRIQKERFENKEDCNIIPLSIHSKNIESMKKQAIILHPLPRLDELSPSIDGNYRSVYFNQVQNGLYMRMAILHEILHR
jgi:aspartate carbamoyltransferase catalytic subunit